MCAEFRQLYYAEKCKSLLPVFFSSIQQGSIISVFLHQSCANTLVDYILYMSPCLCYSSGWASSLKPAGTSAASVQLSRGRAQHA